MNSFNKIKINSCNTLWVLLFFSTSHFCSFCWDFDNWCPRHSLYLIVLSLLMVKGNNEIYSAGVLKCISIRKVPTEGQSQNVFYRWKLYLSYNSAWGLGHTFSSLTPYNHVKKQVYEEGGGSVLGVANHIEGPNFFLF